MDNIKAIIDQLFGMGEMDYRTRLDRRNPEVQKAVLDSANDMLKRVKTLPDDGVAEYVRNDSTNLILNSLTGMMNACEVFSQGRVVSRPAGPTPINLLGAFTHYLWEHPEIEQDFRNSDRFQELCDSGHPDYEWTDKYDDEVPEDTTPGNYL